MSLSEHPQFKSGLMLMAVTLLAGQLMWISQQFDALALTLHGDVSGWRGSFSALGDAAKLCVAILFTTGLLLHTRLARLWQSLQRNLAWRRFAVMLPLQLASFALLLLFTHKIFASPKATANLPAVYFGGWLFACLSTIFTWLGLCTNTRWLREFVYQEKRTLLIGTVAGTCIWILASYTRELWGPMNELTFYLAALLLYGVAPEALLVNVDDKVLGLGDFAVNIAPACSGYEGIGLVTAFTGIYVWLHRRQLRFPRILILFPLAALVIWLLNVVRIDVLILIGRYWSPEIAVGGFHSQAGWLTFILTSLAVLWLVDGSRFFSRAGTPSRQANPVSATGSPLQAVSDQEEPSAGKEPSASEAPSEGAQSDRAIAMIIPLLALLASSILTSSMSAGFDWFYPFRILAVGAAIAYVWPQLCLLPYRMQPIAPIAGLATAILWVLVLNNDADYNIHFRETLAAVPAWQATAWLALRFIGAVVTVPIAEELAFRGYLLSKLSLVEPTTRGKLPLAVIAVAVSSLAFGLLHGAWFAGTLAGLIYAFVRLRSDNITDAIVAHSVTNALLFAYAGWTGTWHLL